MKITKLHYDFYQSKKVKLKQNSIFSRFGKTKGAHFKTNVIHDLINSQVKYKPVKLSYKFKSNFYCKLNRFIKNGGDPIELIKCYIYYHSKQGIDNHSIYYLPFLNKLLKRFK